jgi:hypothetical protein
MERKRMRFFPPIYFLFRNCLRTFKRKKGGGEEKKIPE